MRCRLSVVFLVICQIFIQGVAAMTTEQASPMPSWEDYKSQFLSDDGRIIDNANGNISHSEGQGYGLLLSYLANAPADFDRVWRFTKAELLIRDDGLAAWKWDPDASPHVTDINNASDGDLLIAYGLALAGLAWHNEDYLRAATDLAKSLLDNVVIRHNDMTLLLPSVSSFSAHDRPDGPIINLSYWVFEAFPVMNALVPSRRWKELTQSGLTLLKQAQFGPRKLPADWISLAKDKPQPAEGFDPIFGYNAVRIPLYLMRAGIDDQHLLARLARGMSNDKAIPQIVNLETGTFREPLTDYGYQIINQMMACLRGNTVVPSMSQETGPKFYYPSTLNLLGLAYVKEKRSECLVSRSFSLRQ